MTDLKKRAKACDETSAKKGRRPYHGSQSRSKTCLATPTRAANEQRHGPTSQSQATRLIRAQAVCYIGPSFSRVNLMNASVLPPQWDRPDSLAALDSARHKARRAEQELGQCQAQSKAAFLNLLASAAVWILSMAIMAWVAWGVPAPADPQAKAPLSLVVLAGACVLTNLLALGLMVYSWRKGPAAHAQSLELEPEAQHAARLVSITPTADQIEHWRQVPAVAAQAQAWAVGPLGLLAEDAVQLDAAVQAHQTAQAEGTVTAFLRPGLVAGP